jgi:REP element-mobilizing transposase RayT
MRAQQRDLFENQKKYAPRRLSLGGGKSHAKFTRPLNCKRQVHLVLKASCAKGKLSLLTHKLIVKKIITERARQFRVTLHHGENMGNHLHVVATFSRREDFQNFLRTVTALIARAVTGARKGKPFGQRFWDQLAFTRVITGRRDARGVEKYLQRNQIEREYGAMGRQTVEEYEAALREAKRKGVDVWRILERSG